MKPPFRAVLLGEMAEAAACGEMIADDKASAGRPRLNEILAWACYDIANSTYGTIVATAVYNAYFVNVVAASLNASHGPGYATFLLTGIICVSSLVIVVSAPIIGTISDALGAKKKCLLFSTLLCICATASLASVGPGDYLLGTFILTVASVAFGTGEDLIAAFLPELAKREDMGRISSLGWAAGYVGGLISLSTCSLWMRSAQQHGLAASEYVPKTMVVCALCFAIASAPTFVVLRERARPDPRTRRQNYVLVAWLRLKHTLNHVRHYRDLFSFLVSLFFYSCGTTTVVHLASVYAQQVFAFSTTDLVNMILVVNLTAAVGAALFGMLQDRIGSIKTLAIALLIWIVAILVGTAAQNRLQLWLAANLIGTCLGASGSVGRALVAQFSPSDRSGEFLGLWGMTVKLATCVGSFSFGLVAIASGSNLRLALLSTVAYFIIGLLSLLRVDERRGRKAAQDDIQTAIS